MAKKNFLPFSLPHLSMWGVMRKQEKFFYSENDFLLQESKNKKGQIRK